MVAELAWQRSWCLCTTWANTAGLSRTGKGLSEAKGICEDSRQADLCATAVWRQSQLDHQGRKKHDSICRGPLQTHSVYTTGKFIVCSMRPLWAVSGCSTISIHSKDGRRERNSPQLMSIPRRNIWTCQSHHHCRGGQDIAKKQIVRETCVPWLALSFWCCEAVLEAQKSYIKGARTATFVCDLQIFPSQCSLLTSLPTCLHTQTSYSTCQRAQQGRERAACKSSFNRSSLQCCTLAWKRARTWFISSHGHFAYLSVSRATSGFSSGLWSNDE